MYKQLAVTVLAIQVEPQSSPTWLKMVGMPVDVSSPGLIEQLIAQHIGMVLESLCNLAPELGKVVLYLLLVVIKTLPTYARECLTTITMTYIT